MLIPNPASLYFFSLKIIFQVTNIPSINREISPALELKRKINMTKINGIKYFFQIDCDFSSPLYKYIIAKAITKYIAL